MAEEDDVIRVGIEGDDSDYLAALTRSQEATKKAVASMEAEYNDLVAKVAMASKQLNQVIASMTKQMGEGFAQLPAGAAVIRPYEDEVVNLTTAAQNMRREIVAGNEAINQQAAEIARVQAQIRSAPTTPP